MTEVVTLTIVVDTCGGGDCGGVAEVMTLTTSVDTCGGGDSGGFHP